MRHNPPTYAEIHRIRTAIAKSGGGLVPRAHVRRIDKSGWELCSCDQQALVTLNGVVHCIVCDGMHNWPRFQ